MLLTSLLAHCSGVKVLLIVAGIGVNALLFQASGTDQVFSSYHAPYQDLISGRRDDDADEQVALFMTYYNQERHAEAVSQLSNVDLTNKPLLQLYAGISYLGAGQFQQARQSFRAPAIAGSLYAIYARWYQALAHLKECNVEEAKKLLAIISSDETDGSYQKRAQALMDDLK